MIVLRRAPWFAMPLLILACVAVIAFAGLSFGGPVMQKIATFNPQGIWSLHIGAHTFTARIGQSVVGMQEQPAPAVPPGAYSPQTPEEQWAYDLLAQLGNPSPDYSTIQLVVAWQRGEGTAAMFNPLATTQDADGATCFNYLSGRCGVKNFTSREQGLAATVETLTNGSYPNIVNGLLSNNPEQALNDSELSTWGTGRGNVESVYRSLVAQAPPPATTAVAAPAQAAPANTTELRQRVVQLALSQLGKPYVLGAEGPDEFDCSGLVQWSYAQLGIATTRTTYTQLDALRTVEPSQLQPGDAVYFQYPWDQHVGILADVDGDGTWDMVHAAAPGLGVIVTNDVFADPFYTDAIIGYRTAL